MRKNIIKSLAMVTVVGTLLGTTGLTAFAAEATGTTLSWEDQKTDYLKAVIKLIVFFAEIKMMSYIYYVKLELLKVGDKTIGCNNITFC